MAPRSLRCCAQLLRRSITIPNAKAQMASCVLKNDKMTKSKPFIFTGEDAFSDFANESIANLKDAEKTTWHQLLKIANGASTAKPSKKFLQQSKDLIQSIGSDKFKKLVVREWFEFVILLEPQKAKSSFYNTVEILSTKNTKVLKTFIWMCSHFHDTITLTNIYSLAEKCYKKISGKPALAAALGNACVYTLYKSKGLEGISHLTRLKTKVRQKATLSLIQKYLLQSAKEKGISVHEIEELAVPEFKLENGSKKILFEDYTAQISIQKIGKTTLEWIKPDGKFQKSIPAFVKTKHTDKLKKLKLEIKNIKQTLSAQKERIDRMFRIDRSIKFEHFQKYYLDHGLMIFLTNKLIWKIKTEDKVCSAIYLKEKWIDADGNILSFDKNTSFSLWHPALEPVADIKKWRDFLIENEIQQPLKQAFREVYILTEAEVNTFTYSNRMAAHILKHHQFNALAKTRNWNYKLAGSWDYDDASYAELVLEDHNINAQYWISGIDSDDDDDGYGIWKYISTDQVRFIDSQSGNVLELANIPPIVFSEVMRDVDLFVGVASVGNNPNWQDSGDQPFFRDYWQAYSFGNLTETAKIRKEILSGLIPRLKIRDVAEIKDKFLIVKGKLRTYKIHIGSTNILMEPNDEYLCIVTDRAKTDNQKIFLPFEGDAGLSIILSKALMLAEDDKIKDSTITSQIMRM